MFQKFKNLDKSIDFSQNLQNKNHKISMLWDFWRLKGDKRPKKKTRPVNPLDDHAARRLVKRNSIEARPYSIWMPHYLHNGVSHFCQPKSWTKSKGVFQFLSQLSKATHTSILVCLFLTKKKRKSWFGIKLLTLLDFLISHLLLGAVRTGFSRLERGDYLISACL